MTHTFEDLQKLKQQKEELNKEIAQLETELKEEGLQKIKSQIETYGLKAIELFTIEQLYEELNLELNEDEEIREPKIRKERKKAEAIFKDNDGNEWNGRGPNIPKWLEAHKVAGKQYKDFLIEGTTWAGDVNKPPHWVRALKEEGKTF